MNIWSLIAAVALGLAAASCASKQSPESETPTAEKVELPVERDLAGRIFDGKAPLVFKYRPGSWEELRQGIESRLPQIRRTRFYRSLRKDGPLAFAADRLEVENLRELIDDERAIFLRLDYLGTDVASRAGTFGLPPAPSDEKASGLYARLLLPTDSSEKAAEEVKKGLTDLPERIPRRVQNLGSYLQIDAVMPRDGQPRDDLSKLFDDATDTSEGEVPTPTPTMVRFLEADTAAVYTDLTALREFGYVRLAAEFQQALPHASPENRMQLMAKIFATFLNVGFTNPPSRQSFADAALVVGTDGKEGLVAELTQTRTELGAAMGDETAETLSVPTFDDDAFADTTPLARASGALDVSALTAEGDETPFADASKRGLDDMGAVAEAFRSTGPWGYVGFLTAPEHLVYLLSSRMSDGREVGFPLPSSASGRVAVDPSAEPYPFVGGFALEFEASEAERERIRKTFDRAVSMVGNGLPLQLASAYEATGNESFRVTVGLQRSAGELLDGREKKAAGLDGRVTFDTAADALENLGSGPQTERAQEILRKLGEVQIATDASRVERRVRLHFGAEDPEPLEASARGNLRTRPRTSECLDRLRFETVDLFQALERIAPYETETMETSVEHYEDAIGECTSTDEDARRWARGRWRWFVGERLSLAAGGQANLLRTCTGDSNAGKEERRRACDRIRRSLELRKYDGPETYVDETEDMVAFASALYRESCELGDDAGCEGKERGFEDVPSVEAVKSALSESEDSPRSDDGKSTSNDGNSGGSSDDPSGANVSSSSPAVEGALDKEIIRKVVRQHRREMKYCYEKELSKDPDLEGTVTVQFTISPEGDVVAALVTDSTLPSRETEACMLEKIQKWTFPEPKGGGIVKVNYPFEFSAKD